MFTNNHGLESAPRKVTKHFCMEVRIATYGKLFLEGKTTDTSPLWAFKGLA